MKNTYKKLVAHFHSTEIADAIIIRIMADDLIDEELDFFDCLDLFYVVDDYAEESQIVKALSNGKYLMMV